MHTDARVLLYKHTAISQHTFPVANVTEKQFHRSESFRFDSVGVGSVQMSSVSFVLETHIDDTAFGYKTSQ
jgi:hypothetical protein